MQNSGITPFKQVQTIHFLQRGTAAERSVPGISTRNDLHLPADRKTTTPPLLSENSDSIKGLPFIPNRCKTKQTQTKEAEK